MSDLRYFNLSIPAPRRLAMMRADFAAHAARYPNCPESVKPIDWRTVRGATLKNYAHYFGTTSHGFNPGSRKGERLPVVSSFRTECLPVRSIRFADDVLPRAINHKGWFADAEGYGDRGVIRGIVASLSHGRFLSGYHWSDNGEHVLFVGHAFDSDDDAARDADHEAERYAELCRDDDEKLRAVSDAESLVESKEYDLCTAWEDYRAAWGAYLQNPRHASAAIRAREWVQELITDLRAFRKELTEARAAYERG